jgi:cyclohexyl-isocyanide hydratase
MGTAEPMIDPVPPEPALRTLEPSDDSGYSALWRYGLVEHGHFFRSALDDDGAAGIPTRFTPDSFTLGAFIDGRLIGITSLERERAAKLRHKALISRMFVRPDAEGSGVGKLLLREAIVRAEALGDLRQVYLTVLATNERAQRLYASLGFRGYAREPDAVRIGDGFVDEIQMVRFLRREPRPSA